MCLGKNTYEIAELKNSVDKRIRNIESDWLTMASFPQSKEVLIELKKFQKYLEKLLDK